MLGGDGLLTSDMKLFFLFTVNSKAPKTKDLFRSTVGVHIEGYCIDLIKRTYEVFSETATFRAFTLHASLICPYQILEGVVQTLYDTVELNW